MADVDSASSPPPPVARTLMSSTSKLSPSPYVLSRVTGGGGSSSSLLSASKRRKLLVEARGRLAQIRKEEQLTTTRLDDAQHRYDDSLLELKQIEAALEQQELMRSLHDSGIKDDPQLGPVPGASENEQQEYLNRILSLPDEDLASEVDRLRQRVSTKRVDMQRLEGQASQLELNLRTEKESVAILEVQAKEAAAATTPEALQQHIARIKQQLENADDMDALAAKEQQLQARVEQLEREREELTNKNRTKREPSSPTASMMKSRTDSGFDLSTAPQSADNDPLSLSMLADATPESIDAHQRTLRSAINQYNFENQVLQSRYDKLTEKSKQQERERQELETIIKRAELDVLLYEQQQQAAANESLAIGYRMQISEMRRELGLRPKQEDVDGALKHLRSQIERLTVELSRANEDLFLVQDDESLREKCNQLHHRVEEMRNEKLRDARAELALLQQQLLAAKEFDRSWRTDEGPRHAKFIDRLTEERISLERQIEDVIRQRHEAKLQAEAEEARQRREAESFITTVESEHMSLMIDPLPTEREFSILDTSSRNRGGGAEDESSDDSDVFVEEVDYSPRLSRSTEMAAQEDDMIPIFGSPAVAPPKRRMRQIKRGRHHRVSIYPVDEEELMRRPPRRDDRPSALRGALLAVANATDTLDEAKGGATGVRATVEALIKTSFAFALFNLVTGRGHKKTHHVEDDPAPITI